MLPVLLLSCTPASTDPVDSGEDTDTTLPEDTGPAETTAPLPAVVINELMAANAGIVLDDLGEPSDWIELYNAGAEAVDLSGFTLSDDWTDPGQHTLPEGTSIDAGGWLVLWADGEGDGLHLSFKLAEAGEGVGLFSPAGESVDWQLFPALPADTAYARLPDGSDAWQEVYAGTPGSANRALTLQAVDAIPTGSQWAYLDTGVEPTEDWTAPGFDDSAWSTGPGPLGYGDSHHSTTVSYGSDSSNKHITTWYRADFSVEGTPAESTGALELMCDDGCVLYLNGSELLRHNMAVGEVTADTTASATVSGSDETAYFGYTISLTALQEGENTLAAEVHQTGPTSSDTSFDLGLSFTVLLEE